MPIKFSASNAAKFMHCHASANLDIAIPDWEPPIRDPEADNAANRGTKMHTIFASLMELPTSDMGNMATALGYVLEVLNRRRFKRLIEQPEVADWLPSAPTTTADLVLYLADELHIFDLKTGKIEVGATDNDQMLFYAATYLKYAPKAREVTMHIVQPWAENTTAWTVTADHLFAWMLDAMKHDSLITKGDVTFAPGDHCMFCPANPHSRAAKGHPSCPVLMQMYYPMEIVDTAAILEEDLDE